MNKAKVAGLIVAIAITSTTIMEVKEHKKFLASEEGKQYNESNSRKFENVLNAMVEDTPNIVHASPVPPQPPKTTKTTQIIKKKATQVKTVSRGTDIKPTMEEKINRVLGGKLTGYGSTYVKFGKQYHVNPAMVAAISKFETANGTSKAIKERNNPGGINTNTGDLKRYKTLEDGIEDMFRILKTYYIDFGLTTIDEIKQKYCPDSDPRNGLYGMTNESWLPTVRKFYIEIINQ